MSSYLLDIDDSPQPHYSYVMVPEDDSFMGTFHDDKQQDIQVLPTSPTLLQLPQPNPFPLESLISNVLTDNKPFAEQELKEPVQQVFQYKSRPRKILADEEIKQIFKINEKKQKKNTNAAKILISAFERGIERLHQLDLITKEHMDFLNQAQKKYTSSGRRNIKREGLKTLFANNIQPVLSSKNRQMFHEMLGKAESCKDLLLSKNMKPYNYHQHRLCSKVFRLRCFSKELVKRTQTK